jgi:hypothetical protein
MTMSGRKQFPAYHLLAAVQEVVAIAVEAVLGVAVLAVAVAVASVAVVVVVAVLVVVGNFVEVVSVNELKPSH